MKLYLRSALSLSVVLVVSVGCGKKEEPVAPPAPVSTAPAVQAPAAPAVQAPVPASAPAAETTLNKLTETASKAQSLITQAQKLVSEKNYTGALDILKKLSAEKLTPDQQKLVDDLQATAQKQVANAAMEKAGTEAGKAIGGLLGK